MGTTAATDYSRTVLVRRESKVVEVTLNDIQIPDLWHVGRAAGNAIDRLDAIWRLIDEKLDDAIDDHKSAIDLINAISRISESSGEVPETPDGKRIRESVIDVWHAAIDLKKNLAGDIEKPAKKRKGKK